MAKRHKRELYARTNNEKGFKDNTPASWVTTNGPVWWYGSDSVSSLTGPRGIAAVSRATNLIAGKLAAGAWLTRPADDLPHRWVHDPTLLRAGRDEQDSAAAHGLRMGRSQFWGTWIRSALSYGMGYLAYRKDSNGEPLAGSLMILDPREVAPHESDPARRRIAHSAETTRDGRIIGTDLWLCELRNPTTPMDPYTGMTPGTLAFHAFELGLIDAQVQYASSMYGSGGVPSGYLKVTSPAPLTPAQADGLRDDWEAAHGGAGRKTAVLSATTEYHQVAVSPIDAALAEMRRLSLQDVANAYGVPGWLLGSSEGGSGTYSNVNMELQALYEFTLQPWAVAAEDALSALMPGSRRLFIEPGNERGGWSFVNSNAGLAAAGNREPRDAESPADVPAG